MASCALTVALISAATGTGFAQQAPALAQLKSDIDSVREAGFYALVEVAGRSSPDIASLSYTGRCVAYSRGHSEVAPALIALLARENKRVSGPPGPTPRGEEDFYPSLIDCVAALKDVRALDALLGAMTTGDMATRGIAALGEAAVAPVLKRSKSEDMSTRVSAFITLGEMTTPEAARLSPTAVAAIRGRLFAAIKDPDRLTRLGALRAIENFKDAEAVAKIEEVAKSDPFSVMRGGRRAYPLREEAAEYLRHNDGKQ